MDLNDNNFALSLSVKLKKQTEKQGWEALEHAGWYYSIWVVGWGIVKVVLSCMAQSHD